jgi:hypothetical protein
MAWILIIALGIIAFSIYYIYSIKHIAQISQPNTEEKEVDKKTIIVEDFLASLNYECPYCNQVGRNKDFCVFCHKTDGRTCPRCNKTLSDERFCPECNIMICKVEVNEVNWYTVHYDDRMVDYRFRAMLGNEIIAEGQIDTEEYGHSWQYQYRDSVLHHKLLTLGWIGATNSEFPLRYVKSANNGVITTN